MKTLLMSPPPIMSYRDRWGQYSRGAGDTFPMGIGSIAGYLRQNGRDADVLEPDVAGMDEAGFRRLLAEKAYEVVGISAFTPNVVFALETASVVRRVLPRAAIVFGGAHPTLFPELTLTECREADFVITREGEKPFLSLLEALENKGRPETVPNLWYRDGERILSSSLSSPWLDLDELPLFPYDKFDMGRYVPAPSLRRVLPTVNYMAQRGCPYLCAFCDTRSHGRKVRYRSVGKVMEDLRLLKERYGLRGLIFEGSNFTADPSWIEDLCRHMIAKGLNLSWYCMGRADFDTSLLPLMKKAGLWCMSLGIESASDETLLRMKKNITTADVRRMLQALNRHGISSIGSFILGYPGENEEDVQNTIRYACELDLGIAVFFLPVPFPGTGLHEDALKTGGMKERITWRDYGAWLDHNNPIYRNPELAGRETALYNHAFRKFYLRPRYILKKARGIRSLNDAAGLLKGFSSVAGLIWKGMKA